MLPGRISFRKESLYILLVICRFSITRVQNWGKWLAMMLWNKGLTRSGFLKFCFSVYVSMCFEGWEGRELSFSFDSNKQEHMTPQHEEPPL